MNIVDLKMNKLPVDERNELVRLRARTLQIDTINSLDSLDEFMKSDDKKRLNLILCNVSD